MKIKLLILIPLFLMSASTVLDAENNNQTNGTVTYKINKYTISSGGGVSTGGIYSLTSSIGQIDAGHNASGGVYEFKGGFLTGSSDLIFKNGFE